MNIKKGLCYLAIAAIVIAILFFAKEPFIAALVTVLGFVIVYDAD